MQKHKPKFVLSKNKVIEQYTILKEMVDFVFYSSKTNPEVTSVLEENTDSEFLVHTKEGLKRVKDKAKVLFLAQGWDIEGIQELLSLGITRFIVDNESDLDSLLAYLKNHESKTIDLFLRTKLKENTLKTERYFVFGMSCDIVNRRIKELKDHPCINSLGIHFFRKTQNIAEWNLIYEIGNMFDEETLRIIGFMDIGGGFPCEYANTNTDAFKSIYKKIKELKIWLNEKSIKLIIEPGRFICAPAVKLVTYIQTMYENNIIGSHP